jgi:uncharacterized membrane protein (DUF441 family)
MKNSLVKRACFGLAAVLLAALICRQAADILRLERIDFESVANVKMQEAVAVFSHRFAEIDSLNTLVSRLLSEKAAVQEMEKHLQQKVYRHGLRGMYIIPSDGSAAAFFSNDNRRFRLLSGSCRRQRWFRDLEGWNSKTWSSPVFDSLLKARIVYCCIPLAGHARVAYVYEVQQIYAMFHETGLVRFGLPYMMDSLTRFIAHPLDETRSMLELARDFNDAVLLRMSNDIIQKRPLSKSYIHVNTVTKKRCNETLTLIAETGWLLGVSLYDGVPLETGAYQSSMRKKYITVIVCAVALLLMMICKLLSGRRNFLTMMGADALFPVALLLLTVSVVAVYNRFPQQVDKAAATTGYPQGEQTSSKWDSRRIIDKQSLSNFIDVHRQKSMELYDTPSKIIPTGVYIYSVDFLSSHEVRVIGAFWQKYLLSGGAYPDEVSMMYHDGSYKSKGLFFPGAHVTTLEKTDSIAVLLDSYPAILYRWNFDVEVEQQLSYSLYPFGKNELSLTLWSTNLDDNTVVVPDLDSYKQTYPTDLPGLNNHFHIKGWDISASYFSYSMESYLCNFGNGNIYGVNLFPELAYNISISRKFIDILVCKIVPLMVVLSLLFTILFVRKTSDGFNNIIGCSSLFFVLMLDHINLRENVLSEQIMYLEFCYFFSYILLLLITITSFDISRNGRSYNVWVDTVLKRYFWTIIFGAMAAVGIVFFS